MALIIRRRFKFPAERHRPGAGLITHFSGNLRELWGADIGELCYQGGWTGQGNQRQGGLHPGSAFSGAKTERLTASISAAGLRHFHHEFHDSRKEYFLVLLLDGKTASSGGSRSRGSLNQSLVHPREVFSPAVKESAAAVILVHNHPTGGPQQRGYRHHAPSEGGRRSWESRF
jgi:DNA repair protein RadC